jgi:Rrf2 family protein
VADLSLALEMPKHFLAKILQQLAKAEIISSLKGPGGGFYMSERNRIMKLYDVISCIDGPQSMEGCILGLPVCSTANPCALHFQALAYREGLYYQLNRMTIEEVARGSSANIPDNSLS